MSKSRADFSVFCQRSLLLSRCFALASKGRVRDNSSVFSQMRGISPRLRNILGGKEEAFQIGGT